MVALEERGDSLIVISRSHVVLANAIDKYEVFKPTTLATPTGKEKRISLFKTIWVIHSGEIWGDAGKLIVDMGGLAMIFLSVTGLFYFFAPKLLKRIGQRISLKRRIKRANKWSFKWHLKLGIIASIILLLAMLTGMFLRPPLLIPIANKTVKAIKWSKLDNTNFWDDNLRDIAYDSQRGFFMLATAEGIYALSPNLKEPPVKFAL
ncbi:MAG TPA: PepSY domain-containing protein, partial [Bacteroidetes bacterium]|nr:PepSY domain-containing protein [Bacteroidota bacterium]